MSYSFLSNPYATILSGYLAPGDSFAIFTPGTATALGICVFKLGVKKFCGASGSKA